MRKRKSLICGLGLDGEKGHIRATKGPNFFLIGGSKLTHEMMQEKVMKVNEKIRKRGKTLDTISPKEFFDIGKEVGLKPLDQEKNEN